jgi:hypothetical protein
VKRCCRLVVIVAGLGLMWIADHSLAANQDERPHQAEKKKVSSGILVARRECDRLEAQATKIPFGDVGSLLKEALKACNDYRNSKLTTAEWGERILTLEEKSAFLEPPAEFAGIIPFSSAAIFRGYDSYSLFLFPSADWTRKKDEVKQLYDEFSAFGDAIGDKRLAIWFSEKHDEVDVRRSKLYCDRFELDYNNGPFIVTLQKSPAAWRKGDLAVIISFGGLSAERRLHVLNALEKDLRTARELKQRPLLFIEIRERLLSAAERNKDLLNLVMKVVGPKG